MEPATYLALLTALACGVIWLGWVLFLRLKRRKSVLYLALCTVFSIYLFKVLDYTLFQFQSLLVLRFFVPGLMLRGQEDGTSVNLIPLVTLTGADLRTSLLNVLLLVPFGFGLPFIARLHAKQVIAGGALLSVAIELAQLLTGYLAHMTFRIADVNDVIFNTIGAAIGYWAFALFARWWPWQRSRRGGRVEWDGERL
ncbi:MAG TPA: VanZ family protein [Chloroflexota bacterium]|nr:VanZ family protein [Chloroflexota bacterium]